MRAAAVWQHQASPSEDDAPVADLAALKLCQQPRMWPVMTPSRESNSTRSSRPWTAGCLGRGGTSEAPTVPYADLSATRWLI